MKGAEMSDNPEISEVKILFSQKQDDLSPGLGIDMQTISVSKVDAGAGMYYVIATDRWAFDSIEELVKLLKRVNAK